MNARSPSHETEKGQSLMELAISLVVLVILLAGIVDLGRAFFNFVSMRDAAQEAALYASVYPDDCTRIINRAAVAMQDASYTSINVTIGGYTCGTAPPIEEACAGKTVRVVILNENFPITMPFLGSLIGRQEITIGTEISDTILTSTKSRPPCDA